MSTPARAVEILDDLLSELQAILERGEFYVAHPLLELLNGVVDDAASDWERAKLGAGASLGGREIAMRRAAASSAARGKRRPR